MDKIKITSHQLGALIALFTCGDSIIIISSRASIVAKQDAWISSIVATISGLFFIWMYSYLGSKYPDKTFVEMIKIIFGKWIGGFVAANFVFLCFVSAPQVAWYVSSFITSQYMTETPPYAIDLVFIVVCMIALLYGLETIARSSEIFFHIVFILFILAMLLVTPKVKIDNIFPVLENGITPVIKASIGLSTFTTWPSIILLMIFPKNITNINKAKKSLYTGYLLGSLLIFLSILMSILVLGSDITANSSYSAYLLAKEISIGTFFNRLEPLVAAVWIIALFVKTLMYFYAGIIGLSQLLGLKDYRKIVLPLGLIVLVMCEVVYPNVIYEDDWDNTIWVHWIITFAVILPMVLIIVSFFKKRKAALILDK